MKCPTCREVALVMTERQGVEIDYCPQCRGVWLDRGELDKLLDKAAVNVAPAVPQRSDHRDYRDSHDHRPQQSYRKQKSWLSDIFD